MTAVKRFTALELKAYNSVNRTPHRKVLAAMAAEAKLLPVTHKESYPYGEFPSHVTIGETAEQVLERKMLHGENS